jgi:ribosomal protein L11 methyltransferase
MSRYKATFRVDDLAPARAAATALSDLFEPAPDAATCFEEGTGHRVEAYFVDAPDGALLAQLVADVLGLATPPAVTVAEVPDLNWVAISQAALPPVQAGRFTVHGRHDRGRVTRGPWSIEIDAGEAFGTAHHATTRGCLIALDRKGSERTIKSVLDLGCGSAVLAIAAARLWSAARVVASDIDPIAIEVARDNVRLNGVGGRVRTLVKDGVPGGRFDLVVANILAAPLLDLAPAITHAVHPGGTLVLSGLLIGQAPQIVAQYVAQGFSLVHHERSAGWSALTLVRRGARRVRPKPSV